MNRYFIFTLLILGSGFLAGCEEDLAILFEPQYEKEKPLPIARAEAEAEVRKINHQAERAEVVHRINLMPIELEAEVQRISKERNIGLVYDANIMAVNYKAADALLKKLHVKLAKDSPILVASFVNLDNLSETSTFGRVLSEQFTSRFNQKGYTTIEMKLRTKVFIKEGSGEFLLSREMKEIGTKHRAQAAVVGNYAVASSKVYITARVVDFTNGYILSSHDYSLPIGRNTLKMLLKGGPKGEPGWL